MTSNADRAAILVRALNAAAERDRDAINDIYTDDVRAWTPATSAVSLAELLDVFDRRDDAFSGVQLEVAPLHVDGEYACVEWTVTMTHTGKLAVAKGMVVEPTGVQVTLRGVTVAEFRDDRICSLRQYWDEFSVFEQLGLTQN